MFGIGLGEVLLIILVTFLISPKEIPKVLRKLGEMTAGFKRLRQELVDLGNDVKDIVEDELPDKKDIILEENNEKNAQGRNG